MAGSTQVVSDSWRVRATAADVSCRGARGTAAGLSTDNSTGNGRRRHPSRAQWRRRAAGGALAIDMASLRSVGRCEWLGALQRRMPLAARPRPRPFARHTCCVFIERHSRRTRGCRDVDDAMVVDIYLLCRVVVAIHAMFARTLGSQPHPCPCG